MKTIIVAVHRGGLTWNQGCVGSPTFPWSSPHNRIDLGGRCGSGSNIYRSYRGYSAHWWRQWRGRWNTPQPLGEATLRPRRGSFRGWTCHRRGRGRRRVATGHCFQEGLPRRFGPIQLDPRSPTPHQILKHDTTRVTGKSAIQKLNFFADLIPLLVWETIKYAAVTDPTFQLNVGELKQVLGILLLSGYHPLPSRRHYWNTGKNILCALVAGSISRNRFEEILRCIHVPCADNAILDSYDRMAKLRPWWLFWKPGSRRCTRWMPTLTSTRLWSNTLAGMSASSRSVTNPCDSASRRGVWTAEPPVSSYVSTFTKGRVEMAAKWSANSEKEAALSSDFSTRPPGEVRN